MHVMQWHQFDRNEIQGNSRILVGHRPIRSSFPSWSFVFFVVMRLVSGSRG
jgi:hypothetical protein